MNRWHCLTFVVVALISACVSAPPVAEVRLVSQAFEDLNSASAPLLDDLARAERAQGQANAETRASAPELFNTLTEQSVRGFGLASEESAKARALRVAAYRAAVAKYVVLLDQYRALLEQLVASYETEKGTLTLAGLAERSAQLSAQADAWRRTFAALRMGTR